MREAREAIRLNKDHIDAHNNLGKALHKKGKLDEAIREFREAIRVAPDSADPHRELGLALCEKGQLDEGIAVLEEAIRLDPNSVEPHMNLGIAFERKGLFREAVVHLRRGHETGSRKANWPDRSKSEAQLRDVEQMAELEEKLVKILQGQAKPSGSAERVALAQMCQECKKLYFTSFRFYVEVFADQPQLADDLHGQHRYNAACTAALAGCGQGEDAGKVDDAERARLRRHALEWLRADLARYAEFLDKGPDQARAAVSKTLQHWRQDTDLMGVRGAEALAKFSDAERTEWSKLWQDVARLAKQAAEGKSGQQGPEVRPELVPAPKEVP
jgi:tetratricopeptide (TPR) repeat protein